MKRPRRRSHTDATPIEWAWLTAAPDANPFLGLVGGELSPRLVELWETHEADIREMWQKHRPEKLPPCHSAGSEIVE